MNTEKYQFLKRIDEPNRYFGLPLDELLPCLTILLISYICNSLLIGFVLAGLLWATIRRLKKGQGSGWLVQLMYWHLPGELFKGIFIKTPSSTWRHYLH